MIEAAIDIGTNTMLLLVAEVEPGKGPGPRKIGKVHHDEIDFVRLGRGVNQNRKFSPEAMERAEACFAKYRRICDRLGVGRIHAVATSASRDSTNAGAFYEKIAKQTGIEVEIISGKTEARLSFLGGLLPGQDPAKSVILDIGGGSTEFVTGSSEGGEVWGQSIDIGSVRATEMYLEGDPYLGSSLERLERELKTYWPRIEAALASELRDKEWTGIAGTPTTLAGMALKLREFDGSKVDGYRLDRCAVADWYESLATRTLASRAAEPLLGTGRADIMVAGVAILLSAMEFFDKPEILVSSRGLRHGLLIEPPA